MLRSKGVARALICMVRASATSVAKSLRARARVRASNGASDLNPYGAGSDDLRIKVVACRVARAGSLRSPVFLVANAAAYRSRVLRRTVVA